MCCALGMIVKILSASDGTCCQRLLLVLEVVYLSILGGWRPSLVWTMRFVPIIRLGELEL